MARTPDYQLNSPRLSSGFAAARLNVGGFMDSISRELNLGIQTMASRVRMMHLYYGADGHLL